MVEVCRLVIARVDAAWCRSRCHVCPGSGTAAATLKEPIELFLGGADEPGHSV
jgi:hypothetical protein